MNLQSNPQLELAFDFVCNTNKTLFLTGKAGSGKTTFLHRIKADGTKRLAVVAPTGVAAINAGGMTIHSLFQLPFGMLLPGVQRSDTGRQRHFSGKKIRLIRSLDLLVIDEISMVRADMLDAVDDTLRRYRDRNRPFGGVQLLMIGDLHQLPPVVTPADWDLLSRYYETPYFFSSRALQQTDCVAIELKHIYRQSDPDFIDLLNKVRDNRLDGESLRKLNSRFIADFGPPSKDAYITLTATNAAANDINTTNLGRLSKPQHVFQATIHGEFPQGSYPTEETLKFKVGAQVMFIKNDTQTERRYFNGKIGHITRIDEDAIYVKCPDDRFDIGVVPAEWQNVKYSLNEETKQIEEQILGMFIQYPLKLAWAITIHKSQGLTFERAIIDAQAAFAYGQVYVALSRCKSFEGIVLQSRLSRECIKTDPLVQDYCDQAERNLPSESQLQQAKHEHQSALVRDLFGFESIQHQIERLRSTYAEYASGLPPLALDGARAFAEQVKIELIEVTHKFAPQLSEYLAQGIMPEANESLQVRVRKAASYFSEKITGLMQLASQLSTIADNQQVAASLTAQLQSLQLAFFVKRSCFVACSHGFQPQVYSRARVDAELEFQKSAEATSRQPMVVPKGVPHPTLYRQLLQWRAETAERNGLSARDVLPNASLKGLVTYLPTVASQLRDIHGIGKKRLQRYGQELCGIVRTFCVEQQIPESDAEQAERKPPTASETKCRSFELFRAGKSVAEIAAERELAINTIQGHLCHFISLGELDVYSVLDQETVGTIQQFLVARPDAAASELKSHFGDKYSYGELKLVMSHCSRNQKP